MADAWLKFYPQDWRADERLRNCGLGARGLWMEMLALMHRSERYGYLLINGKAPSDRQLAVQVGAGIDELSGLLSELEGEAVFSRDRNGTIYSRRMIRDEKKAQNARRNGKHGGNPKLCNSTDNLAQDNLELNLSDNGGDKAQKPEARSQNRDYTLKPSLTTSREIEPLPDDPDIAWTGELALAYVCQAADWHPGSDTQRQQAIGIINGWLAKGCSMKLILAGIGLALARRPEPTRSLSRFTPTLQGMRRDELGGELPHSEADVQALTSGVARRLAATSGGR